MAVPHIKLTPTEILLRRCLIDCRNALKGSIEGMDGLEMRFAGGWVRDKLLGQQSHDIDMALSTMTGENFGMALQQFLQQHGQSYMDEANAKGINSRLKDLHKIAANPERSKHLATATMNIFGLDVDFVNLRREAYDDSSRNPQMEFGTPEEDAMRRDACVNALFYNVDTQAIEDFTGRGLQDMRDRVIRTPLEPYQTFKDDPLRVLRLIRFSCRLGYSIEPKAYLAMSEPSIHEALKLKISRERIAVEVNKIMEGPNPKQGLMFIYDRGLFHVIFDDPASNHARSIEMIPQAFNILQAINATCKGLSNDDSTTHIEPQVWKRVCQGLSAATDQILCWTLASYVPWHGSEVQAGKAAKQGIKAPNTVSKVLTDAVRNQNTFQLLAERAQSGAAHRSQVGTTIRNAGTSWRYHVLYSFLCHATATTLEGAVETYAALFGYIEEQNLQEAAALKPIINGNEIQTALSISQPGSWLKRALDMVVTWQFENPHGSVDEAKAMLISRKASLVTK